MTMNARKRILATLLAAMAVTPLAVAPVQVQAQAQAAHVYAQAELDQMLAPIALYPDSLLSQVLMAATYPIEVVEAARWSRANPGLQGDAAVRAVQDEDWDPSVKSLVAFPDILQRMDEKLEWTRSLGDAFLAQEQQMMDQVQHLRRRAQSAGHLQSSEQLRVEQQGPTIIVRQASPEYVYVPYYDPMEVYGTWWWPAYRPVAWAPWPGYTRGYHRPGVSVGFWWGRPVGLSLGFFFGDFDWGRRHTYVVHANSYYYRQPVYLSRNFSPDRGRWQHDPNRRRGVDYRTTEVRQRFAGAQVESRAAQREERRTQRQAAPAAVVAAPMQAQPQSAAQPRTERREERREVRPATRQLQQPAVTPQAQPQAPAAAERRAERREERRDERRTEQRSPEQTQRIEQRQERREDRRAERQAPPAQPAAQPRAEQRDDRRAERQAAMEAQQRQAQQQAQGAQRQSRQEQRANMPAAQAPQTPRAERQEQREERREKRQEQRKDRDKG